MNGSKKLTAGMTVDGAGAVVRASDVARYGRVFIAAVNRGEILLPSRADTARRRHPNIGAAASRELLRGALDRAGWETVDARAIARLASIPPAARRSGATVTRKDKSSLAVLADMRVTVGSHDWLEAL